MTPDQDPYPAPELRRRAEAVALRYAAGDGAPQVIAKGRGALADTIIARAREHGIYVHQSTELVSLLMQVNLDDRIPRELYVAVAELLAWLYRREREARDHALINEDRT